MSDSTREPASSKLSVAQQAESRKWIYSNAARGRFRSRKNVTNAILLIFFLILPWVRIRSHPALLLDFGSGKFSVFGLNFWSHDAPKLFFVLAGAAVSLAFVTSVWGRAWCGWACPQTVFVDGVFRRIERFIEGDAIRRRQLDHSRWTEDKIFKKTLKWLVFGLVSLVLSHSFLAYFIGTDALSAMIRQSPFENPRSFSAMAVISAAVLFDFGWFREQFCIALCPYGRFQSVLMDEKSRAVFYDAKRGEPRRSFLNNSRQTRENTGDCIDCSKCVNVCPTGIDIRDGLQLECIACAACIDACDSVMTKLGKTKGLIRYSESRNFKELLFARPGGYLAALALLVGFFVFVIARRELVEIALVRGTGEPYQTLDAEVINHFRLDLQNQKFETVQVAIQPDSPSEVSLVSATQAIEVPAGKSRRIDFFVRFQLSKLKFGHASATILAFQSTAEKKQTLTSRIEVPLVGPIR